jgi:hypothetical protein
MEKTARNWKQRKFGYSTTELTFPYYTYFSSMRPLLFAETSNTQQQRFGLFSSSQRIHFWIATNNNAAFITWVLRFHTQLLVSFTARKVLSTKVQFAGKVNNEALNILTHSNPPNVVPSSPILVTLMTGQNGSHECCHLLGYSAV